MSRTENRSKFEIDYSSNYLRLSLDQEFQGLIYTYFLENLK